MDRIAIVTAADETFRPFLSGCLGSIFEHELDEHADVVVFDCGLGQATVRQLLALGISVISAPPYVVEVPGLPLHFRAMTLRPYLPSLLPGADLIWWIDADAWVQEPEALHGYLSAARAREFACCVEADRNYSNYYGANLDDPLLFADTVDKAPFVESWTEMFGRFVGSDIAPRLANYPLINAGVFCAPSKSRLWLEWELCLRSMMSMLEANLRTPAYRKMDMLVDQTALNAAVRQADINTSFLPATYNWTCHRALPFWNEVTGKLCERNWPHEPLKVVHLTTPAIKQAKVQLEVLGPGEVEAGRRKSHSLQSPFSLLP